MCVCVLEHIIRWLKMQTLQRCETLRLGRLNFSIQNLIVEKYIKLNSETLSVSPSFAIFYLSLSHL
jgi:hypothetical protein